MLSLFQTGRGVWAKPNVLGQFFCGGFPDLAAHLASLGTMWESPGRATRDGAARPGDHADIMFLFFSGIRLFCERSFL